MTNLNYSLENIISLFVTIALSFLIGLEREETAKGRHYNFGGVRTFPIIGMCGYIVAQLSKDQPSLIGVGLLVIGSLMWLSYNKKLQLSTSGMTTEISGVFTFLIGALAYQKQLWEATALAVIMLLLLELKSALEKLARKVPEEDIYIFTRFLLMAAVILPIVPNQDFTDYNLNPFHIWLIVVVMSGLSYAVYLIEKFFSAHQSILLAAVLGGLYSSTSTTVVLAKRSGSSSQINNLLAGGIVISSGFMYLRLVVLVGIFNWKIGKAIIFPFVFLGLLFCITGYLWMKKTGAQETLKTSTRNPLELKTALFFGFFFTLISALTIVVLRYGGDRGIYGLAFFTGLADVDAFALSLTERSSDLTIDVARSALIIATASNNFLKGLYAFFWGRGEVRKYAAFAMIGFAILSLCFLVIT